MIQLGFPQTDALRRDLHNFIFGKKFDCLFQAEFSRRNQPKRIVMPGRTDCCHMLLFADINHDIIAAKGFADDHTGVNRRCRIDKHRAGILRIKKPVCSGFARFKSNQRTVCPARNIPFVGLITVEDRVHDALALRLGKKFIPVSEKPSCRNKKFQPRPVSDLSHMLHLAFADAHLRHDRPHRFLRNVHTERRQFPGKGLSA